MYYIFLSQWAPLSSLTKKGWQIIIKLLNKLSQYHLEHFFGLVRVHFGSNNNPTPTPEDIIAFVSEEY